MTKTVWRWFWFLAYVSFGAEAIITAVSVVDRWWLIFDPQSPGWWPQVAGVFILGRAGREIEQWRPTP